MANILKMGDASICCPHFAMAVGTDIEDEVEEGVNDEAVADDEDGFVNVGVHEVLQECADAGAEVQH